MNISQRLWLYRISTVLVGVVVGLILAEAGLRVIEKTRLGDRALEEHLKDDPKLGRSLAPYAIGHDANGFRNDNVPAHVDIVALGDSQTWGVNVGRNEAWPQQLAKISGQSVYNMGMGGFGPVQCFALIDGACSLSPRVVIVSLYMGNDLYDAYQLAYSNNNYQALRNNDAPESVRQNTVAAKAQFYWDEEKNFHYRFGRSGISGWSVWLREHLALGRFLNSAGLWPGATDVDYEIDKAWANSFPEHGSVYDQGDTRTVFTTAYRLVALDLDDPHILEGLRITKDLLPRMRESAERRGAHLLVLIIPTKESVYAKALGERLPMSSTYKRLVEMETKATSEITSTCGRNGIEVVDALPALANSIERGEQIYPTNAESHPNAHGYEMLARFVQGSLSGLSNESKTSRNELW